MRRTPAYACILLLIGCSARLAAAPVPIGLLSLDSYSSGSTGTFDIANETGVNASVSPDMSFPVVTPLSLSSFSLTLNFQNGGTVTEDMGQFTSDGSGGFTGNFGLDLSSFPILSAVLTGTLGPTTVQLNNGLSAELLNPFTSFVGPTSGGTLQIGDFGLINASETPEPGSAGLLGTACALFLCLSKRTPRFGREVMR